MSMVGLFGDDIMNLSPIYIYICISQYIRITLIYLNIPSIVGLFRLFINGGEKTH